MSTMRSKSKTRFVALALAPFISDMNDIIRRQLERLNSEAAARTKRERRRANEVKQRTIQRMQLRMVAPLDIGLEQTDASLGFGQEDVFDLGDAERGLRRKGGVSRLVRNAMDEDEDSDEEAAAGPEDEDDALDSEEERECKVKGLEDELDGMYDAYRSHLAERDAKFKVKEQRKKNKERDEEWGGVKERGSDDDESDDDSGGEGGWDQVASAKARAGESSSDDDSQSEDEEAEAAPRKKRRLEDGTGVTSRSVGLIKSLEAPKLADASTRAAQRWFSQDVFAGMPNLDEIEEEEEEGSEEDSDEGEEAESDDEPVESSTAVERVGSQLISPVCLAS